MSSPMNIFESSDIAARDNGENVRNEKEENNLVDEVKEMIENPLQKDMPVPNTLSESSNVDVNPQEVDATQNNVTMPAVSSSGIDKDQSEFPIENKSNDMPSLIPYTLSSQNESFLEGNESQNLEKVGSRVNSNDQLGEEMNQSEPVENETVQENGAQVQQEGNHQTDTYKKSNCTIDIKDTVSEPIEMNTSIEKVTSTATSNSIVSNERSKKESHTQTNGIDNQEDAVEKNLELHTEIEVENNNGEENVAETNSNEFVEEMNVPSSSQEKINDPFNSLGVLITHNSDAFEPQRDESRNDFEKHQDDDLPIGLPLLSKPEQDSMSESSSFKAARLGGSDDESLSESGQGKNSSSNDSSASSNHTNPGDEENEVEGDIISPNKQTISDNASYSPKSTGGMLVQSKPNQNNQPSHDASIPSSGTHCMNVFDDTDENRQLLQNAIERMIEKNVPIFNVNTFRLHNKDLTSRYSKESLSAFLQCQLERMDDKSQEGQDHAIDTNVVTPPRSRSKEVDFFHDSIDGQQIFLNAIHELISKDLEVSYENLRRNYRELTTKYSKSSLEEFLDRYDLPSHEELDLIGTKVAKYFGDKLYQGKVTTYNGEYWRVRYEDDDEEDYNREEVEELMKLFYENRKKKKKSRNPVDGRRKDDCKHKKTKKVSRLLSKYIGVPIPTTMRESLSKEKDWIEDMEYYFSTIVGNSKMNVNRVMTTVKKLVAGHGVVHPQTGESFMKNEKIHLGMDFEKILIAANAYVDDNGGDRGHGWLIQHPVGKLLVYQHTRVENGNKPFRTLLGTGSISSSEDNIINSDSNNQIDASSNSDEDYEESKKIAKKSTLNSWIIQKPPNLCGRRKRSTTKTSEEGLKKLKVQKLSQDSQARKFMDDMESKGIPLNYKNFQREYPDFAASYPRKSISAMMGHRRANSIHSVESDDSDVNTESENFSDEIDTQISLKETFDVEVVEPHDTSQYVNNMKLQKLSSVENKDEAERENEVEQKEESFYALKGYLLTEIMSSETSFHEKKEVDDMFTSYADKFIQDGFHCPAILKAMNDMESSEIDEYLSNTIGMKFAHKLQFRRWLDSVSEE